MKKFAALCCGLSVVAGLRTYGAGAAGAVVSVSTVPQLQAAVAALTSGTTITVQPGRYALTTELRIANNVTNVALVGATGNRDDVVIVGSGMTTPGVNIPLKVENAQDVRIADLTIGQAYHHPIQLKGEMGADRIVISNVRLFDAGQQFIKSTVDVNAPNGVDDVIVEKSLIEYTNFGPADGYTDGVDVLYGANWIIRNNVFRNIRVPAGATYKSAPAILMWQGSRNTQAYGNLIINCDRGIVYGLGPTPPFAFNHSGGAIYNNMMYRAPGATIYPDSGIAVWDSPNTKVYNNTVLLNGTYFAAIEYRFATTTGTDIVNNLTDAGIVARDGATGTVSNNYTQATAAMFINAPAFDLHLSRQATAVLDRATPLALVSVDFEGDRRPSDARPDLGADEFYPLHTQDPVVPAPITAPAAPTGLGVELRGRTVRLSWVDNATNETSYVVERAVEGRDGFRPIGVVTAGNTAFRDNGVPRGHYRYRVRAHDSRSGLWSAYSTVVGVRVQ